MGKILNFRITQYASSLTGDLYKLIAIGYGIGSTFNRDLVPVAVISGVASLINYNLSNYQKEKRIIYKYENKKNRTKK